MVVDGLRRDEQPRRYLCVGVAVTEQVQNLMLAPGQSGWMSAVRGPDRPDPP